MADPKINLDTLETALTIISEGDGLWSGEKGCDQVRAAVRAAAHLERYGRQLRAIATRQCNGYTDRRGGWDQAQQDRDTRREDKLASDASELAARFGVRLSFNGDPRGSAIRIKTPKTGRYNTMGGSEVGWAV